MDIMKKPSTLVEVIKLIITLILCWLLWVIIFSFTSPPEAEEMVEPFRGACLIFGTLTALVITFGLKFNSMHQAQQRTKAMRSNIGIFEERATRLLDKANRVADKYMNFEGSVQVDIAHERNSGSRIKGKIHSAHQFQTALENYPDLKANESIMELLRQIQDCENGLASEKLAYNSAVEQYNLLIHSFPATILRKLFHFADAEFYQGAEDSDMISDEALGI